MNFVAAHCLTDERGIPFPTDLYNVAVGKYYRKIDDPRDNEAQFSQVGLGNTLEVIKYFMIYVFNVKCLTKQTQFVSYLSTFQQYFSFLPAHIEKV